MPMDSPSRDVRCLMAERISGGLSLVQGDALRGGVNNFGEIVVWLSRLVSDVRHDSP